MRARHCWATSTGEIRRARMAAASAAMVQSVIVRRTGPGCSGARIRQRRRLVRRTRLERGGEARGLLDQGQVGLRPLDHRRHARHFRAGGIAGAIRRGGRAHRSARARQFGEHRDERGPRRLQRGDLGGEGDAPGGELGPAADAEPEAEPVHRHHLRRVRGNPAEHAGEDEERVRVVAVHVLDDARRALRERIGPSRRIGLGAHPVHRGEPAHEVDLGHFETPEGEVVEVHPGGRLGMALEIARADGGEIRRGERSCLAHQGGARGGQRIVRPARLGHEQTRAAIGLQVARVHGHAADENEGPAALVGSIWHHRAEGMAWVPAGQCGERAGARDVHEGAGPLGVAGLGGGGDRGRAGIRVLTHGDALTVSPAPARRAARRWASSTTRIVSGA